MNNDTVNTTFSASNSSIETNNNVDNQSTQYEIDSATLDDIHNDIVSLNNNVIGLGSGILFICSIMIGVSIGKIFKLWN